MVNRLLSELRRRQAIGREFNIEYIHAGPVTVRNERGWRDNEKRIEYYWSVEISRSLAGWLSVFTIKFGESSYRDIQNKSELVHGIITLKQNGELDRIYYETYHGDTPDPIKEINNFDLFDAKTGITIGGIQYNFYIVVHGIESSISVSNPTNEKWKVAAKHVYGLGTELASRSGHEEWIEFFS